MDGEERPYVIALADCWVDWLRFCVAKEEVEVCGRVNSSKRSAKRGWCMCRYVAEESLLCLGLELVGGGFFLRVAMGITILESDMGD